MEREGPRIAPDGQARTGGLIYAVVVPRCSVPIRPAIIKNNSSKSQRREGATQDKRLTAAPETEGLVFDSRQIIWYILMNVSKNAEISTQFVSDREVYIEV